MAADEQDSLKSSLRQLAFHCISNADAIVCTIATVLKPSFIDMVSPQITFGIIDEAGKVGQAAFLGLVGSYDVERQAIPYLPV